MTTVGAFEAKTHLNQLLTRASRGEVIQITRRGVPVAKLVPATVSEERPDLEEVVRNIRRARKGVKLGKISIRTLINEGRR
jgi:prevent-host-death family protein